MTDSRGRGGVRALAKPSFLTATFGLICLGSLFARRPLLFYIVRQFVAGDDPVRFEWWNGLWQYPHFRAGQRFVTAVWGVVYLVEALLRIGSALFLSPAQVVTLSHVMAFVVLVALIAWTRRYLLAVRERRIRELAAQAQQSPADVVQPSTDVVSQLGNNVSTIDASSVS